MQNLHIPLSPTNGHPSGINAISSLVLQQNAGHLSTVQTQKVEQRQAYYIYRQQLFDHADKRWAVMKDTSRQSSQKPANHNETFTNIHTVTNINLFNTIRVKNKNY